VPTKGGGARPENREGQKGGRKEVRGPKILLKGGGSTLSWVYPGALL